MASDVLKRELPQADQRIKYGEGEFQFGDLRMPGLSGDQRAPVVVFLHGGWWKSLYGLEYGGHLCEALRYAGVATWSVEYRRVGDAGGGWPGTFLDVAAGFDFLSELGKLHAIDLARVVVVGHSAGGHLAFWLAGRPHIPAESVLAARSDIRVPIRTVIALAGAVDLRLTMDLAGWFLFAHDKQEVLNLMGGAPKDFADRYRAGNPGELLPLKVPQILLQGTEDDQIPAGLPARWADRGRQMGESVEIEMIAGADHLDLVDPRSTAWGRVQQRILGSLGLSICE